MHYLSAHYVLLVAAFIIALLAAFQWVANPKVNLVPLALALFFLSLLVGCTTTQVATSPIGAAVITKVSNNVIDQGLNAGVTRLETGNPYLHAVADGLRSVEGQVLTSADVTKIVNDYGDPSNKARFQTLAADVWGVIKTAAVKIGWIAAAEAAAQGLQSGALNPAQTTP